jgi:hypothetical protein
MERRKCFFFCKKRSKKTLFTLGRGGSIGIAPVESKFFAELFFKKATACLGYP